MVHPAELYYTREAMLITWPEVRQQSPLYLNLGGGNNGHPKRLYEHYIAVDQDPYDKSIACIQHDLTQPLPLPDGSVDRIHCEDFFEHIQERDMVPLLNECYRVLKPQARLRLAAPDYNNPKDKFCLDLGYDPRNRLHITLTHYAMLQRIIDQSLFSNVQFYHYWDNGTFIHRPIDYSLGMIKRTPDNDPRCRRQGVMQTALGNIQDLLYQWSRGAQFKKEDLQVRRGHPWHVTSIVVDLVK